MIEFYKMSPFESTVEDCCLYCQLLGPRSRTSGAMNWVSVQVFVPVFHHSVLSSPYPPEKSTGRLPKVHLSEFMWRGQPSHR